jgi:hypothetical protein
VPPAPREELGIVDSYSYGAAVAGSFHFDKIRIIKNLNYKEKVIAVEQVRPFWLKYCRQCGVCGVDDAENSVYCYLRKLNLSCPTEVEIFCDSFEIC